MNRHLGRHSVKDTAPPRCLGCGYNLTGLAETGRCPECGTMFDLGKQPAPVRRPVGGRGHLLLPTLLCVGGLLALGLIVPDETGGLFMAFALGWCYFSAGAASRVSVWRYHVKSAQAADRDSFPPYDRFVRRKYIRYVVIQLIVVVCVLAVLLLIVRSLATFMPYRVVGNTTEPST